MTTVSIILPTYNSIHIIQPTLDSIFSQTFQDFELIIVDDGSTDSTLDYLRALSDPRIKVFAYPNAGVGGPSVSRNRGLTKASGKYIALINHDDLWSPDKLEAQLVALQQNPEARVAYSWLDHIDINGDFVHEGSQSPASGDVLKELLKGNFIETGSNPLIDKSVFDEVGGFDPTFKLVADWEMWLRLAMRYEFALVPGVQVFFRDMPDALSANTPRMEQDGMKLFNHVFGRLPDSFLPLRTVALGNFYEYLASRTLKGAPQRDKSNLAIHFLSKAIRNCPSVLWRKSSRILLVTAKATAMRLLSARRVDGAMVAYKRKLV